MVQVRPGLEIQFAEELAALQEIDRRPRPPQWQLSPWAVRTYLMGGNPRDGGGDYPEVHWFSSDH